MVESLAKKAARIVSQDRSDAARKLADKHNLYCVHASIYQCAAHLDPKRSLPASRVLDEWDADNYNGSVPPQEIFSMMAQANEKFGLRVRKIFSNPHFLTKLLPIEEEEGEEKEEGSNKTRWSSHAEFFDGSPQAKRRIAEMHERGWEDVMAIEMEDNQGGTPQTVEDIVNVIEEVPEGGKTVKVVMPMIRFMIREKD